MKTLRRAYVCMCFFLTVEWRIGNVRRVENIPSTARKEKWTLNILFWKLLLQIHLHPSSSEPDLVLYASWRDYGSIFQGHNSNSAPIQALILMGESWVSLLAPPPPPGEPADSWYWLYPLEIWRTMAKHHEPENSFLPNTNTVFSVCWGNSMLC